MGAPPLNAPAKIWYAAAFHPNLRTSSRALSRWAPTAESAN